MQNTSPEVSRKREIRLTLRALDGKIVTWPYDHIIVSNRLYVNTELSCLFSKPGHGLHGAAEAGGTKRLLPFPLRSAYYE